VRDNLIHFYFGVDYLLVWNVVGPHVPILLTFEKGAGAKGEVGKGRV